MEITFDFSEKALDEVDILKARLGMNTRGDVVNQGIGILRWLVNEKEMGNRILIDRPDGSVVEAIFTEIETSLLRTDR